MLGGCRHPAGGPGHSSRPCLSIASAGDNTLALLSRGPDRVIALDRNPAQIACLELRAAAYRTLSHGEIMELIGSECSGRRLALYSRCRGRLSPAARMFWDGYPDAIAAGIGAVGKFERYLTLFREWVLPMIHPRERVARLLQAGPREQRETFYQQAWDTWRWRLLFQVFFSKTVMGRLGRAPSFFRYVEGSVASRILRRTQYALTALHPGENPYLQWILTGHHGPALPYALRPENFEAIRAHLDRLEWHCCSLEDFLETVGENEIDRYNLSDIFEYMSLEDYHRLLERLVPAGRGGGRLAYWNLLAERRRPGHMADRLHPMTAIARRLHMEDKGFFYSDFILEEIV